ncbi:MAG: hypothetical protein JST46_17450 [Bacteroidetes bacterium]|nr:hypothetical protein [Bacteroidota bacterium]
MKTTVLFLNMAHLFLHQGVIHFGEFQTDISNGRRLVYSGIWAPVLGLPILAIRSGSYLLTGISIVLLVITLCVEIGFCKSLPGFDHLLLPGRPIETHTLRQCLAMMSLTFFCLLFTCIQFNNL